MTAATTREQIVAAADGLFHRQGYAHTSFADIAQAVRISRGNFYYHFKTKDEILDAVIAQRQACTRAMLKRWEAENADPADRIRSFIDILIVNGARIMASGCPVGTLNTEMAKLDHAARAGAAAIFTLFRDWLGRQFAALGFEEEADALAMHLLVLSQGVATLSNAFRDEAFVRAEVDGMHAWLDACVQRAAAR